MIAVNMHHTVPPLCSMLSPQQQHGSMMTQEDCNSLGLNMHKHNFPRGIEKNCLKRRIVEINPPLSESSEWKA